MIYGVPGVFTALSGGEACVSVSCRRLLECSGLTELCDATAAELMIEIPKISLRAGITGRVESMGLPVVYGVVGKRRQAADTPKRLRRKYQFHPRSFWSVPVPAWRKSFVRLSTTEGYTKVEDQVAFAGKWRW